MTTKGPYPFAIKEAYYRTLSDSGLFYNLTDARQARDVSGANARAYEKQYGYDSYGAGSARDAENWYADDVSTIISEINRRKAGGRRDTSRDGEPITLAPLEGFGGFGDVLLPGEAAFRQEFFPRVSYERRGSTWTNPPRYTVTLHPGSEGQRTFTALSWEDAFAQAAAALRARGRGFGGIGAHVVRMPARRAGLTATAAIPPAPITAPPPGRTWAQFRAAFLANPEWDTADPRVILGSMAPWYLGYAAATRNDPGFYVREGSIAIALADREGLGAQARAEWRAGYLAGQETRKDDAGFGGGAFVLGVVMPRRRGW